MTMLAFRTLQMPWFTGLNLEKVLRSKCSPFVALRSLIGDGKLVHKLETVIRLNTAGIFSIELELSIFI